MMIQLKQQQLRSGGTFLTASLKCTPYARYGFASRSPFRCALQIGRSSGTLPPGGLQILLPPAGMLARRGAGIFDDRDAAHHQLGGHEASLSPDEAHAGLKMPVDDLVVIIARTERKTAT